MLINRDLYHSICNHTSIFQFLTNTKILKKLSIINIDKSIGVINNKKLI